MTHPIVNRSPLPDVLWAHTFSFLPPREIALCEIVSIRWYQTTHHNKLWQNLAAQSFGVPPTTIYDCKRWLSVEERTLKSNEELVAKVKTFLNQITLNQTGHFTCSIRTPHLERKIQLSITGSFKHIPSVQREYFLDQIDTSSHSESHTNYRLEHVTRTLLYDPHETIARTKAEDSSQEGMLIFPRTFPAYDGPAGISYVRKPSMSPIALEYQLRELMDKKIDQLTSELIHKTTIKKATVLGIGLIGGYCLYILS